MNCTSFSKPLPSEAPGPFQVTVPETHGRFGLAGRCSALAASMELLTAP